MSKITFIVFNLFNRIVKTPMEVQKSDMIIVFYNLTNQPPTETQELKEAFIRKNGNSLVFH